MVRSLALLTLSLVLLITPATPFSGRAAARAAVPVDGGWPRLYSTGSGARFVLYEPQIASWADEKRIVMYAAVSYSGKDQRTLALGTLRIEAETRISRQDRLVEFSDLTITAANFPSLSLDQLTTAITEIKTSVPRDERVIGLDRVLAALDTNQVTVRNVDGVRSDPPVVFYSTKPAVVVNLDGDPVWSPTKQNGLRFALNSSRDLFEHVPSSSYYLRIGVTWMKATSLDGPWTRAGRLPGSFSKLPADDNWKDARRAAPDPLASSGDELAVLVSRRPAELMLLRGAPVYVPVRGTGLQWISNTDSDVFRAGKSGLIYYLVSGRWFSAPDFKGPWTFATPTLPGDFRKIPLEHQRSHVLASVPGTPEAAEAVLLAQAPQIARVSRTQITAPDVVYQGEPQFQPIEQATVERAVNTDKDVLKISPPTSAELSHYYMCYHGVWFVSTNPTGPWTLADSIPKQIYAIPISSPAYAVTAVTVQSADDGTVVYAADAAYTGVLVAWGCAVWGTGWHYAPYVGWKERSPVYYPRRLSYGDGVRYNPWTASYARPGVAHAPGPARQGADVYGSWGSRAVERGDLWAKTSRFPNGATSATMRATQGRGGESVISRRDPEGGAALGRTDGANVFAGYDGHVYRYQGGRWQKYESYGWNTVERDDASKRRTTQQQSDSAGLSSSTRDQLNHDLAARRSGTQRTSEFGIVQSRSGPASHGEASHDQPTGTGSRTGA